MADLAMPRLSDSMEEGTILKWLKADGDTVTRGEELVEIETDKANMTYEADTDGVLSIIADEGDTLAVGQPIARIGAEHEPGAKASAAAARTAPSDSAAPEAAAASSETTSHGNGSAPATAASPESAAPEAAGGAPGEASSGRIKASPLARRIARELGIDLTRVQGSGPGGRIVKADVEAAGGAPAAVESPLPAPAADTPGAQATAAAAKAGPAPAPRTAETGTAKGDVVTQELTRLQQVVARRMAESKATAPEFVLSAEVDMEEAVLIRGRMKELAVASGGSVPSFNDMVIKACAIALKDHPRANGAYKDAKFELYSRVNIGVAVAAQDALVVPTIFDADRKTLGEISRDVKAVAARVRSGEVTPPELSGGTFTVSNLGMFGVSNFTAVINPPQAAILAVGAMTQRPVVRDGEVVVRHIMDITLTCDHRILYGADAALFLGRIRELLEQPLAMAL